MGIGTQYSSIFFPAHASLLQGRAHQPLFPAVPLLSLNIGGVDRTANIWKNSISLAYIFTQQPNQARITVFGFDPIEAQLVVLQSGRRVFAGQIQTLSQRSVRKAAQKIYDLNCIDWSALVNRRRVTKSYAAGASASTIFADIVSSYTSGFSQNNVQAGAPTVTQAMQFRGLTVTTALQQICDQVGWQFRVDEDRDFHFVPGPAATPTSVVYNSATSGTTFVVPAQVNRITVKAWGAGGGADGGYGARLGGGSGFAQATIATTPGESITVRVGGGGARDGNAWQGGGGGGYSGLLRGASPLLIAPGGGGASAFGAGGPGGGTTGTSGSGSNSGGGGSQVAGGTAGSNSDGADVAATAGASLQGGSGGGWTTGTGDAGAAGGTNGGGAGGAKGSAGGSNAAVSTQYLIVAAGGSGGSAYGGGGGAGQVLQGTDSITPGTATTVVVGTGGAGIGFGAPGNAGGGSSWNAHVAAGGSGGPAGNNVSGGASGSGQSGGAGGGFGPEDCGGGGGDAGAGSASFSDTGGSGGPGTSSSLSGSTVTYSTGGGGCGFFAGGAGGGSGAIAFPTAPSSATAGVNPGDGGGGANQFADSGAGSNGLATLAVPTGTIVSTSGHSLVTSGGLDRYTWSTPGTYGFTIVPAKQTGGGGGGGYFGGGGGGADNGSGHVSGGGGGSSFLSGTATATSAGSGATPGNNTDGDYDGVAGIGGNAAAGARGLVKITYTPDSLAPTATPITESNYTYENLEYQRSIAQLRTFINAVGGGASTTAAVAIAAASIPVDECFWYAAAGGLLVTPDGQILTYTGRSAASGPGNITGVSGIAVALLQGTTVNILVQVSDSAAMAALALIEGGDGRHEDWIENPTWTNAAATAKANAYLTAFKSAEVRGTYDSYDDLTVVGAVVPIVLATRGISVNVTLQQVTAKHIAPGKWKYRASFAAVWSDVMDMITSVVSASTKPS